jgi:hypothetical protein
MCARERVSAARSPDRTTVHDSDAHEGEELVAPSDSQASRGRTGLASARPRRGIKQVDTATRGRGHANLDPEYGVWHCLEALSSMRPTAMDQRDPKRSQTPFSARPDCARAISAAASHAPYTPFNTSA